MSLSLGNIQKTRVLNDLRCSGCCEVLCNMRQNRG